MKHEDSCYCAYCLNEVPKILQAEENPAKTVNETLDERAKTHGDFESYARTMVELIATIDLNGNGQLTAVQHQGLYMILSKITRIINGNANHADSWHDIAGYATLVERNINNG